MQSVKQVRECLNKLRLTLAGRWAVSFYEKKRWGIIDVGVHEG